MRFAYADPPYPGMAARYCHSRSGTAHGGPLVVHHVGGLSARARLVWMCEKHNQEDAGHRVRRFQDSRGRARRPRARS